MKVQTGILAIWFAILAMAFPGDFPGKAEHMEKLLKRQLPVLSENERNSGPIPNLFFDAADQFVDVRPGTEHEFRAPGPNDKRGPCPGLNAAANHGFIGRSGIATIPQCIDGFFRAFGLEQASSIILCAIGIATAGDILTQTWSIGGAYHPPGLLGLFRTAQGLSYSHNAYESDASITRYDSYLHGGNAYDVNIQKFDQLYNRAHNFTLDIMRQHNSDVKKWSIANNPYFFSGPFSGLVAVLAHQLAILLLSNHGPNDIQGYLDRETLKSFYSITGPDNAHVWTFGHERIPQNHYRRPSTNPYGFGQAAVDLAITELKYKDLITIGGNTGTVNSFVGVDPIQITGGQLNLQTLLQADNFACWATQIVQAGIASSLGSIAGPIIAFLQNTLNPVISGLTCNQFSINFGREFDKFPGANFHPKEPGTL